MKKLKIAVASIAALLLVGSLTGCGGTKETPVEYSFSASLSNGAKSIKVGAQDVYVEVTESQASDFDPNNPVAHDFSFESSDPSVLTVDEEGNLTALKSSDKPVQITVYESVEDITRILSVSVYSDDPLTGLASYKSVDVDERTEILGKLEKYAMEEHLTGVSLFENGGYVMYNPRIQKGTEEYITGYGFGILGEGNITEDLKSESNVAWKRYYHSATSSDPKNINAWDAEGTDVSDLASYIQSGYWSTKMNATKDGYEWYPVLAKENRPVAVEAVQTPGSDEVEWVPTEAATGKAWKFHIKTGEDGVKYTTASTKTLFGKKMSDFNGLAVQPEDYLYSYMVLLTQSFELYRGAEMAADDTYGIVGAAEYFQNTATSTGVDKERFSNTVGIHLGEDAEGHYLVIETVNDLTPFDAMYSLSSGLTQPLPASFISAIGNGVEKTGVANYGAFISSAGATPVDTILSLGTYTLEYWEEDKTIAFARNADWFEIKEDPTRYKIPGVKITVYKGANTDNTLIIKEFLAGNLDAAGLPTIDYVKKYRNDPRTTTTKGDSVFKLNINSCTEEVWEEKFGVEGSVAQTPESGYWDVKPWMSNDAFLDGINASIDRDTFASNRGMVPSNNYFSSNYMSDPEGGVSYNTTQAHKDAIAGFYPETNGYNLAAAKIYFRRAVEELVAEGKLERGTRKQPTEISIEVWWMSQADITDYGNEIGGYIEKAFNSDYVSGGTVKLKVVNKGVTDAMDVYYKHLMVGQFDLGFGSISGNSLNPLNFMEVLKSDNSSGFTLNWGPDTSVVSENLVYDNKCWSYDALWQAADTWVYAVEGRVSSTFEAGLLDSPTRNEDGSLTVLLGAYETISEEIQSFLYGIVLFATNDPEGYTDYGEILILADGSDGLAVVQTLFDEETGLMIYKFVVSAEVMALMEKTWGADAAIWGIDAISATIAPSINIASAAFWGTVWMADTGFPQYQAQPAERPHFCVL